ncbi:hypothetical protein [Streptosporangium sp. NPDC000509]
MVSEPGEEWAGQSRADEAADAGEAEGEAVLPGGEGEVAEHEDGEQR